MAVPYDFFRTPQPKNKDKVRYHARVVVRDTMETEDIARQVRWWNWQRFCLPNFPKDAAFISTESARFVSVPTHRQFVPRKRFVPRAYSSKALFSHRKRS